MANNIDRLFREGLDQFEMTPAPASWDQVQGQIAGKKNKVIIWQVAAAISIIFTAALVIWNYIPEENNAPYVASIDHPSATKTFNYEWNVPTTNKSRKVEKTREEAPAIKTPLETREQILTRKFEMLSLASINETSIKSELKENIRLIDINGIEIPENKVKITYIASNKPDTTKTNNFGQFLEYLSKDLEPATLLADIRDAKNQLLSRN